MTVVLRPGRTQLADWRAIYRGERAVLHPEVAVAVAASADAVARILDRGEAVYGVNTGFGKLAGVRIETGQFQQLQRNIVLSHAAGVGPPMPTPIVRLMLSLKLASLARGASGVRPETLALLQALIEQDLSPVIPAQGSVGASGDLAPLSHLAAVMIGVGQLIRKGETLPAAEVLAAEGLRPLTLGPKEGLALLNGTQFSTAYALAGLFEAEILLQSALVAGALSTEAAKGSDTPFDPRIHALRGHRGQIEAATALRGLMHGSSIRASHLIGDPRVQDPYASAASPRSWARRWTFCARRRRRWRSRPTGSRTTP